ncbi:MAG: hypothetical protein ABF679_07070 [Lentilactobacillus diolivorans]|uniref:hypothetical protein n=1 Tax=Lentilactobacillus diolivorans TaxID=179838 RepID=UPI0039ED9109
MKKYLILLTTLALGLLFFAMPIGTNAAYLNGNGYAREATHLVRARKAVRVYRVTTGNSEASNRFHFAGYLHKGSKVFASGYLMSTGGGRVIKSKYRYYHNYRTFFFVFGNHWLTSVR